MSSDLRTVSWVCQESPAGAAYGLPPRGQKLRPIVNLSQFDQNASESPHQLVCRLAQVLERLRRGIRSRLVNCVLEWTDTLFDTVQDGRVNAHRAAATPKTPKLISVTSL